MIWMIAESTIPTWLNPAVTRVATSRASRAHRGLRARAARRARPARTARRAKARLKPGAKAGAPLERTASTV